MYHLLCKKIMRENLPDDEEKRRCYNVVAFWAEEGNQYIELAARTKGREDVSFNDSLLSLGYVARFILLCEGKEPTLENIILNHITIYKINSFLEDLKSLPDD